MPSSQAFHTLVLLLLIAIMLAACGGASGDVATPIHVTTLPVGEVIPANPTACEHCGCYQGRLP